MAPKEAEYATADGESEGDDDYMNMVIAEPSESQFESSMQRRKRKEREAEQKGRTMSKKEQEADAAAKRAAALETSLSTASKGFKMMEKLGFKQGDRLGSVSNPNALSAPIDLDMKDDRGGIGMDSEKKRKVREAAESETKRVKATEGDYRERVAKEREERRHEGQLYGAMKIAEDLDTQPPTPTSETAQESSGDEQAQPNSRQPSTKPNVLWRTLVRQRAEKEREKRMRHDLLQSLTRNEHYDDPEEDAHDRQAFGTEDVELDEEDPELEEFVGLEVSDRLSRVVDYLRESYHYCFWCKFRYPDKDMEGCPGLTEEDHD